MSRKWKNIEKPREIQCNMSPEARGFRAARYRVTHWDASMEVVYEGVCLRTRQPGYLLVSFEPSYQQIDVIFIPRDYEVYEDNAGTLILFIFDFDGCLEYANIYTDPADLRRDLGTLRASGTVADWHRDDGHDDNFWADYYTRCRADARLVADWYGTYLRHAGLAAHKALL